MNLESSVLKPSKHPVAQAVVAAAAAASLTPVRSQLHWPKTVPIHYLALENEPCSDLITSQPFPPAILD